MSYFLVCHISWFVILIGLSYSLVGHILWFVIFLGLQEIWIPQKWNPLLQEPTSGSSWQPSGVSQKSASPTSPLSSSSLAQSLPSSTGRGAVVMLRWDHHQARNGTYLIYWMHHFFQRTITNQSHSKVPLSLFYALALYVIAPFAHWVHLSHGAHQYYVTTSVNLHLFNQPTFSWFTKDDMSCQLVCFSHKAHNHYIITLETHPHLTFE